MKKPVKAVTIYPSGKITLLGAKSKNDIEQAVQILEKDLYQFKKS
jgi:TATA-box binding protein (TBP) (component of TFIID and TFIIIB)